MSLQNNPYHPVGFAPSFYEDQDVQQIHSEQIEHLRHLQQQASLHQQQQQQQQLMYQAQMMPNATYNPSLQHTMEYDPMINEKKTQNKAARRAEHNAIERARREHLNTKFQQLAHSLPNLNNDRRPSKGTIIERTLEFVKLTIQKEERYKKEIRELSRVNRSLMRQVTSPLGSSLGDADEDDLDGLYDFDQNSMMDDDPLDIMLGESLSPKSSCSSLARQSFTSTPSSTASLSAGDSIGPQDSSSTTTSPCMGYNTLPHPPTMISSWDTPHSAAVQQQMYDYCHFDKARPGMPLHIKFETYSS